MPTFRFGALDVVSSLSPKEFFNRALQDIDPRLFVEQQLTLDKEIVWCVCMNIGAEIWTIWEWRDASGKPIPELASGLLDRIAEMKQTGSEDLNARVVRRNKELIELKRRERAQALETIVADVVPRVYGRSRPVLPRSQKLRQSRDRMRNEGKKV